MLGRRAWGIEAVAYSGFTDAPSFGYTYDELGNIAAYTENGTVYTYTYDDLNQLTAAVGGGKTYAYTYDLGGNILTATDGTTSHTYTYGDTDWADLLTAFDGEAITYDGSGNPLSYYNGSRYTFTWQEGRRLATASGNGHNVSYTYDMNGLRLSRTVDGTKIYSYAYIGDRLSEMTIDDNGTVRKLSFVYDSNGPYAVTVTNGSSSTTYYYVLNLQGDVVAIVNGAGTTVVEYTYDPWGKLLSIDGAYKNGLGIRNPLRYRGYVYDTETQMYYLQSRYYDPTTCRFINADAYTSTGQGILGHNIFAYCLNNPIILYDATGQFGILSFLGALAGGAIGGALTSTASYLVDCAIEGKKVTASGLKHAAGSGAISGALGAAIGSINTGSSATTQKYKAWASGGIGIAMGIKSAAETEGSPFKKGATGLVSGIISGGSTFLGSQIDAYSDSFGFSGNLFTNFAATIFVGVPAEILYVAAKQGISGIDGFAYGVKSGYGTKSSQTAPVLPMRATCATVALAY